MVVPLMVPQYPV